MTDSPGQETRKGPPFDSPEQEAHLGILHTAAALDHAVAEVLRPHGITPTQYNVLRILRNAGEEGLGRNQVRDQMVARVPDATRLLDRMETAGLIVRSRSSDDRRVVHTRISDAGRRLLAKLGGPVAALHGRHFGSLSGVETKILIRLLDRIRATF